VNGLVDFEAVLESALPERGQILAVPLSGAIEGFVADQVDAFVATDVFRELWVGAAEVAHTAAVRVLKGEAEALETDDGTITLNLVPVVNQVLQRLTAASPEILGRQVDLPDVSVDDIPEAAITRIEDALGRDLPDDLGQITVYDDGALEAAQEALRLFEQLVIVSVVGTVVFAGAALWVSQRRRRTLLQLVVGAAIGMVILRRVAFRLRDDLAELPPRPAGRAAADLAVGDFLDPLLTFSQWVLIGLAVVALVAVATADYPWVVTLRHRIADLAGRVFGAARRGATDDATVNWIAGHGDVLQVAVGVVTLVLLWILPLSWPGVLIVLAAGVAAAVAVRRVHATTDGDLAPAP
jgi:hypothetical protein